VKGKGRDTYIQKKENTRKMRVWRAKIRRVVNTETKKRKRVKRETKKKG